MTTILCELELKPGNRVAVLVNGLGATSQIKIYLICRRMKQHLDGQGIHIHGSWVGEYATSLEMVGASITLMKLDNTLQKLLDHLCHTTALTVGTIEHNAPMPIHSQKAASRMEGRKIAQALSAGLITDGDIPPALFKVMMQNVGTQIITEKTGYRKSTG